MMLAELLESPNDLVRDSARAAIEGLGVLGGMVRSGDQEVAAGLRSLVERRATSRRNAMYAYERVDAVTVGDVLACAMPFAIESGGKQAYVARLRMYDLRRIADRVLSDMTVWAGGDGTARKASRDMDKARQETAALLRAVEGRMGPRSAVPWREELAVWAEVAGRAVEALRQGAMTAVADPSRRAPSVVGLLDDALKATSGGPVRTGPSGMDGLASSGRTVRVYQIEWSGCVFAVPLEMPSAYLWGAFNKACDMRRNVREWAEAASALPYPQAFGMLDQLAKWHLRMTSLASSESLYGI